MIDQTSGYAQLVPLLQIKLPKAFAFGSFFVCAPHFLPGLVLAIAAGSFYNF